MNRHALSYRIAAIALTAMLLGAVWNSAWCLKPVKKDFWHTKENLMLRLGAEWHKIGVLQRESAAIADVLASMRDIELYPTSLTGYNEDNLVKFDKAIETLEKQNRKIEEKINSFKAPLIDAIAIFRELVVGEPVISMFSTLEKANLRRITEMLEVKHDIDTLWRRTDTLLSATMRSMNIDTGKTVSAGPIEDEFFSILKANLGLQAESYYSRLNGLKNRLIKRATADQVSEMVQIERHHVNQYLTEGNLSLARKKIDDAIDRFSTITDVNDFYLFMTRVLFQEGAHRKVLETLQKIPDNIRYLPVKFLFRIQSLYALHEYAAILADTNQSYLYDLSGADRNLALWIVIESAIVLRKTEKIERLAALIDRDKPYGLHVVHALARSYLAVKDDTTALSILEQAKQYKITTDDDRMALQEVNIVIAQIHYERGNYDKAIELFYKHMNNSTLFERALSGIVWCYLRSGRFEKAETALRKLVNQAPETPWGAEGILILARRYLQIASFAWKKHSFVTKEKQRLTRMLERLDTLGDSTSDDGRNAADITYARKEIAALLSRVGQEKIPDYETIAAYYEKIDRLCAFITSHYYTGTFQEASFSENRERLLHTIDSLTIEIEQAKNAGMQTRMLSNAPQERLKIKNIVDQASIFSSISMIDRYRWEREYIDWRKSRLNDERGSRSDSTDPKNGTSVAVRSPADRSTSRTMDSLLASEDALQKRYSALLQERIVRLLSADLDRHDACYLKYQLGELYYQKENNDYARAYERFDKAVERFGRAMERYRNGEQIELPKEPSSPLLCHDKSMNMYRAAIASDTTSPFCAASHYSLAWCFNDLAKFDSAYAHMRIVASRYPDNPHAAQAWMFCGEYHFDKGNLKEALAAFYTVMKYPESEWFDESLYKVAWTQYRLSNPEKAISSFLALVDLGEGKFGHSLLEKESMDYIAISFSETDVSGEKGLERATAFARRLGDTKRGCQILHRLAQVFRDQGRNDMAKKAYERILSSYPNYENNPFVEAELLSVLERDASTEMSIDQKYMFFKKYHRKSAWARRQPDSSRAVADSTASRMLYDASISYHQLALQKNNDSLYHKALASYTDYIGFYPRSPLANECHYNLAEILFSLGNYRKAAEEYIAVSKRYPDSKYKETAAWNAIVASQNLLKIEASPVR
ncbi:MAG: tetratricopeptide repeat protein [Chitinispirillaceae bacterium]|nr:tetratricopeptide repeat protein [Chitinispirillaceae bacterium]